MNGRNGRGFGNARRLRARRGGGAACEGCPFTLDRACTGDRLVVRDVDDDHARMHAIRFGMAEGSHVTCLTRIPGGPVVVQCGRQEIAIGRKLAQRIRVQRRGSVGEVF